MKLYDRKPPKLMRKRTMAQARKVRKARAPRGKIEVAQHNRFRLFFWPMFLVSVGMTVAYGLSTLF